MPDTGTNSETRIGLVTIFGVATALGLFSGLQASYYVATFTERPADPLFLIALNLGYWYSWACLTPAVLRLAAMVPFDRQTWRRALAIHVPGVFIVTMLHVAVYSTAQAGVVWLFGEPPRPWLDGAQRMFFNSFDWEMMTYWAIVGLSYARHYHREARDRALRESQLETSLIEARLQALQRQLQPHFLFNTLHTISALMHRDVDAADAMIVRLSDLLRLSLQTVGVQEVPLKQELEFLSKYLEIEQTRYRDRLTVVYDIAPDTLDAMVPNLALQPLVENSIKHGFGPKAGPGRLLLRSRRVGQTLELEVRDNGVGMSSARLSDFNRGVGLGNTRSRLQHLYGAAYRFEFRQLGSDVRAGAEESAAAAGPGAVPLMAPGGLSVVIAIPLVEPDVPAEELSEDVA